MEISKYIKEILIGKDNVIVAGFGAFEKTLSSAKIDPVTGEMHPPQVTVIFRPELQTDSGILVKYIAEKEKITEENAAELIKNEVTSWDSTLMSGQELILNGLGVLSKDPGGLIVFKPTIQPSDFPESYGLPIISVQEKSSTVPPVVKKEPEKKITEPLKKEPVKATAIPKKKVDIPQVEPKSNKKLIIGLAIGIPIAAILILGALNFNLVKQKFNSFTSKLSSNDSTNVADTIAIASDSLANNAVVNTETAAMLENYTIVNAETNTRIDPKSENLVELKKIYIIAGSYRVKNHAVRQRNKLNKKGFNSEVLPVNNGLYRVSISSYEDIQSAVNDFERIRSIDENLDVWLLINK